MRRRQFLTLLGGAAAAWPVAAIAQVSTKRPLIAWLSLGERTASWTFVEAFLHGMRDFGYTDGDNFEFAPRFADGYIERLPMLAQELVQLRPSRQRSCRGREESNCHDPDREPRARRCRASGTGRERVAAGRQCDRDYPLRGGIACQADGACARGRAPRSPDRCFGQRERPESTASVARAGGGRAGIGSDGRRGRCPHPVCTEN
jgi:hypothetical protein